jgi:hypothetical protein
MKITEYNTLKRTFENKLSEIATGYRNILKAKGYLIEKRSKIIKEHEQNKDNMFSSIFRFRLENFHSELLGKILNKNTNDTGNIKYLKLFQEVLYQIRPTINRHTFDENVAVECEYGKTKENGRIDVYVHDDTHAIIIENKINNAPDQPNQLAKYLKISKSENREVVAIVYMPMYKYSPLLDNYDDEYKTFLDEIKEKLIILPALDIKSPEKDLAHGFLDLCYNVPENTERQKFFILQYAKLLKSIEGVSNMTAEIDMELLADLYKNKKDILLMENISEIWDRREGLLGGLLKKQMRDRLISNLGFHVDAEDDNGLYKEINDKFMLCYYSNPDDNLIYIGVWSNGKLKGNLRKTLDEILCSVLPETYFGESEDWDEPQNWLIKQFYVGEYKETLSDISDYLFSRYNLLNEKMKSVEI